MGVGSRCPGKVLESERTRSKGKVKTFARSTGRRPEPALIQLNMPSLSFSLLCVSVSVCLSLSSVVSVKSFKCDVFETANYSNKKEDKSRMNMRISIFWGHFWD